MKNIFLIAFCFISISIFGQDLEQNWTFNSVKKSDGTSLLQSEETKVFSLSEGKFQLPAYANKPASTGTYLRQNNLIIFNATTPKEELRYFNIVSFDNASLVLSEGDVTYTLASPEYTKIVLAETDNVTPIKKVEEVEETKSVIENEGIIESGSFTFTSFWRGALGMFSLIVIAFLFSSKKKAIDWKKVGIGLALQLIIAIGVLKVSFIQKAFELVGKLFIEILEYTKAGSKFLFDGLIADMDTFGYIFAFQVLPTIIFFSALTSLLFYLGIIQWMVKILAIVLSKFLGISGMESLSVAGNIFLGQTEAPLLIKAYLEKMNKSEMLLVMIGGMATVAGAVLAAYIGFLGGGDKELELVFAKHLLAASVMAAPGAIVISKILYPQTEEVNTDVTVSQEKIGSNILDAIANGTTEGLRLAVNVGAMLLVFVAVIAMINGGLGLIGDLTSLNEIIANNTAYDQLSLEFILGYVFAPLMWLIGVPTEDMTLMGQLLGIKLAASEFVGYIQLAELKNVANATHLAYNKSIIMATYMLCGFANFASIGIQIGGIGSLAPGQRKVLSEFGMKALIGGTIASLMSATIAGMIIG
ncbi:NupC/NupG family nucleoside CNT transporter [Polaribacter sp. KT 15]|uniref:NupC/NupG family nucleoside CNT transporter n=1 Tax=Polaribacter sp. KT 15 TaxID=1896175 RepID=UPI0009098B82|nr:nucleoside transporter C-terminal domain-containing protein [Polaribacter sp. KT 15]SHM99642.1 concentrative nucleoside transporter, CNT family [Polaribacter sp. KT 15]